MQFCLDQFVVVHCPTTEDVYQKKILLDGNLSTVEILDTLGGEGALVIGRYDKRQRTCSF